MRNFFGLFIFCIWATFARYYYVCEIKNHCDPEPEKTTLSLFYENEIVLENYQEFRFNKNSITPNLSTNNNLFLDKVASWLINHPDQHLNITGISAPAEVAARRGVYENLALERAGAIQALMLERGAGQAQITLDGVKAKDNDLTKYVAFQIYDKLVEEALSEEEKQATTIE